MPCEGQVPSQRAHRVAELEQWLHHLDATGNWQRQDWCTGALESKELLASHSVFCFWRMWSVADDPVKQTGLGREMSKLVSFHPGMSLEQVRGWKLVFQENSAKSLQMQENEWKSWHVFWHVLSLWKYSVCQVNKTCYWALLSSQWKKTPHFVHSKFNLLLDIFQILQLLPQSGDLTNTNLVFKCVLIFRSSLDKLNK